VNAHIVNEHNLKTVPTVTKRHAKRFNDCMFADANGTMSDALAEVVLVPFPDDPLGWTGDMTPEQVECGALQDAILERFGQKVRDSDLFITAANEVLNEYREAGNGKTAH